jgi:hypothetical protein
MIVVSLLVVIAILLYLGQPHRDYTLGIALLIAALTWLSIEVHLLHLLRDVVALALDYWLDTLMALCAVILLIVPATMLYVGVRDPVVARHTVLDKFERRVATLMALGYGRTEAETTALHQMKRDLSHSASGQRTSHNM